MLPLISIDEKHLDTCSKSGLKMNAENALKLLGKVKYVVITNPKGASQRRNCPSPHG